MDSFRREIRAAIRVLARKPGVTALAVASLALAIGFSTAAFSVLDAFALRDLPVAEPQRLVRIYVSGREQRADILSWIEYEAVTSRSHLLDGAVAESRRGPKVRLPDRDDFPITGNVSDNYFDVLGVKAALGNIFHGGKGQDGTVVLSNRYWKQALGNDAGVIGRNLEVGGALLRVIGVLPPGFTGTNRGLLVDLFVPPQTSFGSLRMASPNDLRFTDYETVGRLRRGSRPEQVRAEVDAIMRQVEKDGRAPAPERRAVVEPFTESGLRAKIESNAAALGVVVLLVLIAAANLANLRLVDNEGRRHETGIRLALGAGRLVLARQHIVETLLLSAMGTAAGLVVAVWLIRAAPALLYGSKRYTDFGIRVDTRTLLFSSAALLLVAVIGALIPLADAWKRRVLPAIQANRQARASRWLTGLVVAQMALVTGVACSAALLWRSLDNLAAIRPAMDPNARLLIVEGALEGRGPAARAESLALQLATLPGVEQVGWARRAPLSGSGGGAAVDVEMPGVPKVEFAYNQVSPNYFAVTGGRLLGGRVFQTSDGPDATLVAMVNLAFTRRFFNGRQPLGEWVKVNGKQRQIVGVVEDGPANHLKERIQPYLYLPFAQRPTGDLTFFLTSQKDPGLLADSTRSFLRGNAKAYTILDMVTLRQHMRNARGDEQATAEIVGGLAGIGLVLAAAGLFGVTLYAVARRTSEFGLRVALGATPGRLLRQVLKQAGVRIAIAIPLGWALAWAARHAMGRLLYGVAPDDPWMFALAAAVVAAVGCIAVLPPAVRAARIDPITALRHD
jgi:putative ABC transport system permease protein